MAAVKPGARWEFVQASSGKRTEYVVNRTELGPPGKMVVLVNPATGREARVFIGWLHAPRPGGRWEPIKDAPKPAPAA